MTVAMTRGATREKMLIAGEWVESADGRTFDVETPAKRGSVMPIGPSLTRPAIAAGSREPSIRQATRYSSADIWMTWPSARRTSEGGWL